MQISVDDPQLEQFIAEKVKAGEYASVTEVVEAGLARLMLDPPVMLSEEEERALDEAERCIARGETLDWAVASAQLRRKYLKST